MRLKVFRAADMRAAMAQVRSELGGEASILNTRRVAGGVEITAALEPEQEPGPPPRDPARLSDLAWHGVPPDLQFELSTGDLHNAIVRVLRFASLPMEPYGPPVMLTGPPGAGKTFTIVRLATRLTMRGVVPMVITTDCKRAGATEQLAAFTRLLGIPLMVANQPASLARALAQRTDGGPVLIDTFGADPRDPGQAAELTALAAASEAHVALVLPAGLDPGEAADVACSHAEAGAASLIATRLDVAHRMGGIVAASAAARLPLTEAGIGSGAADGLVPFTPLLLAARLSRSGSRS
jgi:flagellar biosynthesis protein FlhF